jgi:protein tyrosine phosphatase (PTP) superfamily phosphohydrolase (DUF442 family)
MGMQRRLAVLGLAAATVIGLHLSAADPRPQTGDDAPMFPLLLQDEMSPLHNLIQVSPRLYSGSEPHGSESFARLKELGVTTIVSVDGAAPDVEAARAFGINYVHIPIGYDGISKEEAAAMTRVMRDVEGPVYIHCHHGKHRGPAAAAVCAIADGTFQQGDGEMLLKLAQTSPDYAGLYRDVAAFQPLPADAELPQLVEVAEIEPLVAAMARIGRLHDELKEMQTAQWQPSAEHPDRLPNQVAILLMEELRESGRNLGAGYGDDFVSMMKDCETAANAMAEQLRAGDNTAADASFKAAQAACSACHKDYRN